MPTHRSTRCGRRTARAPAALPRCCVIASVARRKVTAVCARILLAYDGRPAAQRAYDFILKMPPAERRDLAIVAVIRPSSFAVDYAAQTVLDQAASELGQRLAQLERRVRFAGSDCTTWIRLGEPVKEILKTAEEWRAGLIVTGQRFPEWMPRWGRSVSARLRSRAACPVRVVVSSP